MHRVGQLHPGMPPRSFDLAHHLAPQRANGLSVDLRAPPVALGPPLQTTEAVLEVQAAGESADPAIVPDQRRLPESGEPGVQREIGEPVPVLIHEATVLHQVRSQERLFTPTDERLASTASRGAKRASFVMTFTTPPMASVPYNVDWGPLRISSRSTVEGWIPFRP